MADESKEAKANGPAAPKQFAIVAAGRINDPALHMARVVLRSLASENSRVTWEVLEFTEADWEVYLAAKLKDLGTAAARHRVSPLVTCNGTEYIGRTPQLTAWVKTVFDVTASIGNRVLYTRMANKAYRKYIDGHKHPHCYLDLAVGSGAPERVVVELFASTCARTCENFRQLCTGEAGESKSGLALNYKGTPIHRVVPNGWLQGGDIAGGHGDGGESVYGPTFGDESFDVKHDRAGVLSMASTGPAHSNGSQFFITLAPMPCLDGKRVAFGRVVSGMRTLKCIERLESKNQRPTPEVVVAACGVFTGAVYGSS